MSSRTGVEESDKGKKVVNADGEQIGIVADVKGNAAHVDPDPGLTDKIRSKLGWSSSDTETFPLPSKSIDSITDNEIRLNRDL